MDYQSIESVESPASAVFYDPLANEFRAPYLESRMIWTPFGESVAVVALGEIRNDKDFLPVGAILNTDYFMPEPEKPAAAMNVITLREAIAALEKNHSYAGQLSKMEYFLFARTGELEDAYADKVATAASALRDASKFYKSMWYFGKTPEYLILEPQNYMLYGIQKMEMFSQDFFRDFS